MKKMQNKRKFGQYYQADRKRFSKELLVEKTKDQENFYVRTYKTKENAGQSSLSMSKGVKEIEKKFKPIPDSTVKVNSLNSSYASIFSCERNNNQQIQTKESDKPFTISINSTRKRISAIGRMKSIVPDGIPGEILKLGVETMIPYRARLLDIMMNNNANPGYWEKPVVVPIYKGEIERQLESTDRSA